MTAVSTPSLVPQVGDIAPDFTLASTSGEKVTLSAFRGQKNVLLAFFPLAFTSTCTAELCAMTDDYEQFSSPNVDVLPISVDAVPSLKEFRAKYELKEHLLSDFKRDASRAYGVLMAETFHSRRAYFLVDKGGILRWVHVEEHNGLRRENTELLAEIAKLA
jgi:peroxiredoxin